MAFFINGAAGNINPSVTDQTDPAVADQEGKKLGMAVLESTMEAWTDEVDISIGRRSVQLPYRDQRMTAERFDGEVERRLHEQTEFHHWPDDLRRWGTQMKRRLASGTLPDACTIEIGAFRIGPALFLLSQGEVFNEYQLRAKRNFPGKRVFFVAYTNGMRGYIPTADAFRHKGYEVDQAYVYMEEPSPLTPEADAIYLSAVSDLLRQVSS